MIRLSDDFKNIIDDLKTTVEFKVEEISFDIAAQVYDRLKELDMNQNELASTLGVSKSYVSQVLSGKSNLTIESIVKIADAINLQTEIKLTKIKIIDELTVTDQDINISIIQNYDDSSNTRGLNILDFNAYKGVVLDGNNFKPKSDHQTA